MRSSKQRLKIRKSEYPVLAVTSERDGRVFMRLVSNREICPTIQIILDTVNNTELSVSYIDSELALLASVDLEGMDTFIPRIVKLYWLMRDSHSDSNRKL